MNLYFNNDICPKCAKLTDHRHGKTCSDCFNAYHKVYRADHREEAKTYQKVYYAEHKEEAKTYQKVYYAEHKEEVKAYQKTYHAEHWEKIKAYQKEKLNSKGIPLHNVRLMSRRYLYKVLNHPKLDNYEIHHCFGYDDHTKFVYIPKELHLKIHQYLRDNNIDAKTEHFKDIEHLINEYQEYKYILKL